MKSWVAIAVAVSITLGGWVAIDWFRAREAALSEMPPRSAYPIVLEARNSVVLANLAIAYPVIENALNAQAARLAGSDSGSEDIKCISNDFPRFRECLTVNWSANYGLNGRITVARDGDKIKVTVPGRFNGQAGFGGYIAKLISINAKNFDGAFTVSASASLDFTDRFCPVVVPGEASFGWTSEGRVELVGRSEFRIFGIGFDVGPWNLDIGRHFNGQIREALRGALADAGKSIPCESLRAELKKVWRTYSIPVAANGASKFFVNVDPTALGTSGLIVEDGGVRVLARMAAKVVVATTRGNEEPKADLPAREAVPAGPGRLDLAVPLKVPYPVLSAETMKAVAKQPLTIRTAGGDLTVIVRSVDIYPSGAKIAVGVGFSADLPWRLFDAQGTIWVTGKPVVEGGGTVLRLDDVAVTRQLDNSLWATLTLALKEVIDARVKDAARYDLSPVVAQAIASIETAVVNPANTGGVRLRITEPSMRLGRIVAEEQDLAVEGLMNAKWDASLDEIKP